MKIVVGAGGAPRVRHYDSRPSTLRRAIAPASASQRRAAASAREIEHCLQIEGRPADDLQHVCGGGLLLQRFRQLARARLHLVEQAHVLDRDHRLVGEGLDQLDLLIGERVDNGSR